MDAVSDACEYCGTPHPDAGTARTGRPRKFCNDVCRQAAHRARKASGTTAGDPALLALTPALGPRPPTTVSPASVGPSAGDELIAEIVRDIQDASRELLRALETPEAEEPLMLAAQMQEKLDGLVAGVVGRARHRRVTWAKVSNALKISEDTARHRFTERHILRRLSRFARRQHLPASLGELYTPRRATPSPRKRPPGPASTDRGTDGTTTRETGPPAPESNGAAYNRLAPVLSMLVRTAKISNKDMSAQIGCSASYLSRILNGERVPTWELTRRIARVCGADPDVLRNVWESQKLSSKRRDTTVVVIEDATPPALELLHQAIRTLYLRAGRPAPHDLAVASRWTLAADDIAVLLEAGLPAWNVLEPFVTTLGGDLNYFRKLLDNALEEEQEEHLHDPSTPTHVSWDTAPAGPSVSEQPTSTALTGIFAQFSSAFRNQPMVESGKARLLQRLAERNDDRQQRQTGKPCWPRVIAEG
jgi:transcriptional regulator with XRE-family HTH domain